MCHDASGAPRLGNNVCLSPWLLMGKLGWDPSLISFQRAEDGRKRFLDSSQSLIILAIS